MSVTIQIYGTPKTRVFRAIWAAEEAGVPYEVIPVALADTKAPEFLAINPNGKIPALRDGDLVLFESFAINWHIAQKAGPPLLPEGTDQARCWQWTLWTANEMEPASTRWSYNSFFKPPEERIASEAEAGRAALAACLKLADAHLAQHGPFLLGDRFTIADANMASMLYAGYVNGFDYGPVPALKGWMEACIARPAARRAIAIRG